MNVVQNFRLIFINILVINILWQKISKSFPPLSSFFPPLRQLNLLNKIGRRERTGRNGDRLRKNTIKCAATAAH